jgi:glycolate oxidase FAD binding subunit
LHETVPAIAYQLERLKEIAYRDNLEMVETAEDGSRALWSLVADFHKHCGAYLSLRASMLPSQLREVFARCDEHLSEILTETFVLGQPGTGVLRVEGAVLSHEASAISRAVKTLNNLRADCQRIGGLMIIERAPIEIKRQMDVWGDVGESLGLMRAIKRQFDPNQLLNPRRFVGGI